MSEKSTHRWIKENVEAVAIAIVMALVIRQFAIEAFKIPTESMAPTLLGDVNGGGTGDRILVDKIPVLLGQPERWRVIVFKYPLNEDKNYIKRLVGLGGETLTIRDGDVIIDGEISRKPDFVQEVLFFPVYPGNLTEEERARAWVSSDGDPWSRAGEDGFLADNPNGPAWLRYTYPVEDDISWNRRRNSGRHRVGDVRLTFTVTPESGEVRTRIVEHRVENEVRLAVGEGKSWLRHGDERVDLPDVVLDPGDEVEVSFANVDDALVLVVDGDEYRHEYESIPSGQLDHSADEIAFGVEKGKARFTDLALDRDVYYVPNGTHRDIHIPEDHYFMLGDNSLSSKDSREWDVEIVRLPDGRIVKRDADPPSPEDLLLGPPVGPGEVKFQDIHGFWIVAPRVDIEHVGRESAPFVPAENLIGRAFFVFWPLNPFTDQFRLKFIR